MNREEATYEKQWRQTNRERAAIRQTKWRRANLAKVAARSAKWRKANPGKVRAQAKKWRKNNQSKVIAFRVSRRTQNIQATPAWVNHEKMAALYETAQIYRDAGFDVHVDHIVPLKSKLVCGLHVEYNLRILPANKNTSKGNRHWPDMPL